MGRDIQFNRQHSTGVALFARRLNDLLIYESFFFQSRRSRQHLSFYVNWSDKSVLSSVMPKSPPSHFFLVLSSSNDAPNFFHSRFMGFRKTLHYFLNIAVDSHCCYAIQVFNAMRLCKLIYALWCKTETDGNTTGILSEAPIPRHRYHGCLYQYRSRLRTHENISIGIGII